MTAPKPAKPATTKTVATPKPAAPARAKAIEAKPSTVTAKPEVVAAKPSTVTAKPEIVAAKPKTVAAKPAAVAKAPAPEAEPVPVRSDAAPEPVVETSKPVAPPVEAAPIPDAAVSKAVVPAPRASAPARSEYPFATPFSKVIDVTATPTIQGYEEFTAFGKANLDAFVEANSIFVKGVEEISKELLSLTRSSVEQAAAAASAILAAKTLKDVVELNTDFAKTQYEKLIANTTRIGELSVKLATESSAPLTARANRVVETVVRPAV